MFQVLISQEPSKARMIHASAGDSVVLTGWRGEVHWGGYAKGSRQRRLVGSIAKRFVIPSGDGDWHRWLYRDVGGYGA